MHHQLYGNQLHDMAITLENYTHNKKQFNFQANCSLTLLSSPILNDYVRILVQSPVVPLPRISTLNHWVQTTNPINIHFYSSLLRHYWMSPTVLRCYPSLLQWFLVIQICFINMLYFGELNEILFVGVGNF